MMFERIGAAQIDKGVQCLKIQIGTKIYLIGLQDLQAINDNRIINVYQIAETPAQQETTKKE